MAHRYRVPEPDGPTALATCQYCQHQRTYRNSEPDGDTGWRGAARSARATRPRRAA